MGGLNFQYVQFPNDFPAGQDVGAFGYRGPHEMAFHLEVGSNSEMHSAPVIMSKERS